MKVRFVFCSLFLVLPTSLAFAFPAHDDICVFPTKAGQPDKTLPKIVSKKKLALEFLDKNGLLKFAQLVDEPPSRPEFGPEQWRRIFVDPAFCQSKTEACIGPHLVRFGEPPLPPGVKVPDDNSAALDKVDRLRASFAGQLLRDGNSAYYSMTDSDIGTDYFIDADTVNKITCETKEVPSAPKAVKLNMPDGIRLRANSDDLNVDKSNPVYADAFKSVKPATLNFSRDGVAKTNKAALQATLGYAIPLFKNPSPSGIFTGEVVPYISSSQSSKKVDGMAATYTDTNNVAVGALLNTELLFKGTGLNNVILMKPQYLWNTKDKSEIASLKFIYAPWTSGVTRINTPMQLGGFFEASWLQLLFDLRTDVGQYTKRSTDPMLAMSQTSFDRSGSKFGFSLSTNNNGPHVVLTVTETLLYGFVGSVKHLDLFESTLSYYFDSTSNYAFTLSYTKGNDENTAERTQTFMAGLSAKF